MKIYYLAPSKIPSREANSIHVMNMCSGFVENGHEVVLVIPSNRNVVHQGIDLFSFYNVAHKFNIVRFPWFNFKFSFYVNNFLLAFWLKLKKKDIIYSRYPTYGTFTVFFRMPTIFEFHQPLEFKPGGRIFKIYKRLNKSKYLLRIVVISEALKKIYLESELTVYKEKLLVAHDAANMPAKTPHFFKNNKLNIGYVGHLYKGRGIDIVVKLAKKNRNFMFHIIGGNDEDVLYWKRETKGIENIIFYGFMPPCEAERYRLGFDILLAPYQKELSISGRGKSTSRFMSPLKIFEYMSAGKAIIVSDLPVLREVLKNGHNALLVNPTDVEAWNNNLQKLNRDKGLMALLGKNAKSDFECNYTWYQRAQIVVNDLCRNY